MQMVKEESACIDRVYWNCGGELILTGTHMLDSQFTKLPQLIGGTNLPLTNEQRIAMTDSAFSSASTNGSDGRPARDPNAEPGFSANMTFGGGNSPHFDGYMRDPEDGSKEDIVLWSGTYTDAKGQIANNRDARLAVLMRTSSLKLDTWN